MRMLLEGRHKFVMCTGMRYRWRLCRYDMKVGLENPHPLKPLGRDALCHLLRRFLNLHLME